MKTNNILLKNRKGFTLLELIVVIAIISILAVIALPSFTSALKKARDSRRVADLRTVQSKVASYAAIIGSSYYPDGLATTTANLFAVNSNNQFTTTGATTTLAAIYKAQGEVVPAAVINGDVGYAVYGCQGSLPAAGSLSPITPSTTGFCTNYAVFAKLEDASSTILTTNPASVIGIATTSIVVFTN